MAILGKARRLSMGAIGGAAVLACLLSGPAPAAAQSSHRFPTPIRHVVVIYQENHAFDETLGYWCNTFTPARCDGFTGTVHLASGASVPMAQSPDIVPSVDHSVAAQALAIDGGKMDGWDQLKGCLPRESYACLTYYVPSQIPNLTRLATRFAISDETFSMADSPSWGGHLYAVAATTDNFTGDNPLPINAGPGWGCDSHKDSAWINPTTHVITQEPSCIPDPSLGLPNGGAYRPTTAAYVPTIMDRLNAAGLSWRFYASTDTQSLGYIWAVCPSFAECLDSSQKRNVVQTADVVTDARSGTLPNFSLVLPPGSESTSQHNGYSMLTGDNWIGKVVGAIEKGPDWNSTAIFIVYDDCGCFYDHVSPHTNADGTPQGPRVPLVVVSPYAVSGYTDTTPTTFAGIIAYEEHVFALSALGVNDGSAYAFANAFDYSQTPLPGIPMVQSAVPPGEVVQGAPEDDPT